MTPWQASRPNAGRPRGRQSRLGLAVSCLPGTGLAAVALDGEGERQRLLACRLPLEPWGSGDRSAAQRRREQTRRRREVAAHGERGAVEGGGDAPPERRVAEGSS